MKVHDAIFKEFMAECLKVIDNDDYRITSTQLSNAYTEWSKKVGYTDCHQFILNELMCKYVGLSHGVGGRKHWKGCALRSTLDEE